MENFRKFFQPKKFFFAKNKRFLEHLERSKSALKCLEGTKKWKIFEIFSAKKIFFAKNDRSKTVSGAPRAL